MTPLFLTAGAVIHALANEQDIRKFGGLQQTLIFSYGALLIGTLALIGTPFLTGFYSKDVILELACARYSLISHFSYLLTCFSVFTTSYYSFRLLFFCFYTGTNANSRTFAFLYSKKTKEKQPNDSIEKQKAFFIKSSSHHASLSFLNKFMNPTKYTNLNKYNVNAHDVDWVMGLVLFILALGSIYAGWFFKPMFIGLGTDFWNNAIFIKPNNGIMIEAEFLPQFIKLLPLVLTISGAGVAYLFSVVWVQHAYKLALYCSSIYTFLNQRWFYDKLLNETIGYSGYYLGFHFIKVFDKGLLEVLPIFGLGFPRFLKQITIQLGKTQSGLIYHYATIMILTALCGLAMLGFTDAILFSDPRVFALMLSCVCFLS